MKSRLKGYLMMRILLMSAFLLLTVQHVSPVEGGEEEESDDDYDEALIDAFIKNQEAEKDVRSPSEPPAPSSSSLPLPSPPPPKSNFAPSPNPPSSSPAVISSPSSSSELSIKDVKPFSANRGPSSSSEELEQNSEEVLKEKPPCVCVKYFLCNIDNGTVVDDGNVVGLIDIRLGNTKTSPCDHYFDICCQNMRETSSETTTNIRNPEFKHSVCGKRNADGVGFRITGATDQEAQFGEFPWMAAIVKQERQEGQAPLNVFLCGGSLIHPRVILTAAHCVYKQQVQDLKVRLGEWDTQTPDELYPHEDRFVVKMIIHEGFYPGALYNDIALLILNEDTTIAPNIDTVCLPPANVSFDGQRCYASGWGKDSFGQEGKYQVILKKIDLPVVPRRQCENSLRRTRLGRYFRLHDSFVCAGGEKDRDTCRGDGGSPLVCKMPGSDFYVQYGIVAWGIGCGDEGTPGVYVNVPMFVPWIQNKMMEAKFDTTYFKIGA